MSSSITINQNLTTSSGCSAPLMKIIHACYLSTVEPQAVSNSSPTIISFTTTSSKSDNTDNSGSMWTNSSPTIITIPATGTYLIQAYGRVVDSGDATNGIGIYIYKNGSILQLGGGSGTNNAEWWNAYDGGSRRAGGIECVASLSSGDQMTLGIMRTNVSVTNNLDWANFFVVRLA